MYSFRPLATKHHGQCIMYMYMYNYVDIYMYVCRYMQTTTQVTRTRRLIMRYLQLFEGQE